MNPASALRTHPRLKRRGWDGGGSGSRAGGVSGVGGMALKMIRPTLGRMARALPSPPKLPDEFYTSPRWRAFSSDIRRQRGYRCQAVGCKQPDLSKTPWRAIADHIVERKDGGADFDPLNIMVMCIVCHNRKTSREKLRRERGG